MIESQKGTPAAAGLRRHREPAVLAEPEHSCDDKEIASEITGEIDANEVDQRRALEAEAFGRSRPAASCKRRRWVLLSFPAAQFRTDEVAAK